MADTLISTAQIEIYDNNNIRIGYMKNEPKLYYKKTRYDIDYINKAIAGSPIIPTIKNLNLIDDTIEYLAIITNRSIKISINGSNDLITVNGQLIISGTIITSVSVYNEDPDNDVKLEIIQGDELI